MSYQLGGRVLWQRFLNVKIHRKSSDLLQIELILQETSGEDRLGLLLSIKDFTIKEAILERPRSTRCVIKPLALLFLNGRSIYLKEARNLRKAVLDWGETGPAPAFNDQTDQDGSDSGAGVAPPMSEREHFANLFLELITNVLQAELFLLPERGYSSLKEYDNYFSESYADSCILYSKALGNVPEYSYTQGQVRQDFLFSRNRGIFIFDKKGGGDKEGEESLYIHGHLSDSFHEMALSMHVLNSPDYPYLLKEATGNFLRFPNPICGEAAPKLEELVGMQLLPGNRKKIISELTGPEGCSHLCDLVIEAARALQELKKNGEP
ncbi:MAG: DUF2889 domain-containing protein [Dethiobacteria bacterium]|jgi:hypothetical protein